MRPPSRLRGRFRSTTPLAAPVTPESPAARGARLGMPVAVPVAAGVAGTLVAVGGRFGAAGVAGIAAILIIMRPVGSWWRFTRHPATRAFIAAMWISVSLAVTVSIYFASWGEAVPRFAANSLAKSYLLPVIYTLFAFFLLVTKGERPSCPVWWWLTWPLLAVSTLLALILQPEATAPWHMAEGAALIIGFLVVFAAGLAASRWNRAEQSGLSLFLAVGGLVALIVGKESIPFVALAVPATFAAIYVAVRSKRATVWAVAIVMALLLVRLLSPAWASGTWNAAFSITVLVQVAVCAGLVAIYLAPKPFRLTLLGTGGVAAAVLLILSGILPLLAGKTEGAGDITLSHRAYEASVVYEMVGESVVTTLFGLGPGATVDLGASPDAQTLLGAGRTITEVNDVHFLPSFAVLKLGLLGLFWVVVVVSVAAREVIWLALNRESLTWERCLALFVAVGVVASLPAATNLFTNPTVAGLLGVLISRRLTAR